MRGYKSSRQSRGRGLESKSKQTWQRTYIKYRMPACAVDVARCLCVHMQVHASKHCHTHECHCILATNSCCPPQANRKAVRACEPSRDGEKHLHRPCKHAYRPCSLGWALSPLGPLRSSSLMNNLQATRV